MNFGGLLDRRRYLHTLTGTALLSGLAGCNSLSDESNSDQRNTETQTPVLFTDTPTQTSDPAPTTTPTTRRTPTETDTQSLDQRVFDGGDSDSFARAVRTAAETDVPLVIEPGTYEFDPLRANSGHQKQPHIGFRGLDGLTIHGNGATIKFTDPQLAGLWFTTGQDITIQNLTLDYDPVPFTQGEIKATSEADRTLTVTLDHGYPSLNHQMFDAANQAYGIPHQPDGSFLKGIRTKGSPDKFFSAIESIGNREFQLELTESSDFSGIATGNRLTIVARDNQTALRCYKITNPTFENVTIRASNGGAFTMDVCETPSFHGCSITTPSDSDRQISTVADGIRITNCIAGSTIESCHHERLGDDSIAVDNHMATVSGFESERTISVDGVHPFVVKAGDILDAISPSGIIRPELPSIEDYQARFPPVGDRGKPETITFEEPVQDLLETGDFLGSTVADSSGYTIRDNTLQDHRANLIRANSSDGLIENNVLDGVDGNAIELHTGTRGPWPPTCWIANVTVRDNKIRRAGMSYIAGEEAAAIYLHHETPPGVATEARPNSNVTIVNNNIENCASVGIEAEATEGLRIEGNSMRALNQLDYSSKRYGVDISNIHDGRVLKNDVVGSAKLLSAVGIRRGCGEVTATDNTITLDGEERGGELIQLLPVTFQFNRTVVPSDGGRQLTFCCYSLALLDSNDNVIQAVDVGGNESGVTFGEGIDGREEQEGQSWRWFGPEDTESVLYFHNDDLEASTTLRLEGYAIEAGIAASVGVDGTETDEIEWYDSERDRYRISIES